MNTAIPTLVLSYTNPDLDTYGCALAYAELLRAQGYDASAGTYGMPTPEVQFMLDYLGQVPLPELNPSEFSQIIVVDCSWPGNLDTRLDRDKVIEVIDHREGTDHNDFPNSAWNIEMVGAAATLIGEKFEAAGITPSKTAASLLLAGIFSNSMNLQSAITNHRDHHMVKWLNQFAQLPEDFAITLFKAKSDVTGNKLHAQLHGDLTTPLSGEFGIAQLEMVGAADLINGRWSELSANSDMIKSEQHLKNLLIAMIDVAECATYFFCPDQHLRKILSREVGLSFDAYNLAKLPKILLRKEYIPAVKQAYLHHQANQPSQSKRNSRLSRLFWPSLSFHN